MKLVKIRSLKYQDPAINWDFQSEDPQEKIDQLIASGALGLPDEYTIEIEDISYEHELSQVLAKRKSLYPSPEEFLNAFFDGGEQALEELRQRRLVIKQNHPKPIKE